jgi:hypothetical protein
MGRYSDGKTDNHRRSGKVLKEDSKRTFTAEQRQQAADRLQTARKKKK